MVDEPKVKVKVYLEDFLAKFQLVTNKVTSWGSTTSDDKYPSEKLVKDSLDAKASSTHTHGNITNDGKLGTASRFVVTDSSKNITVQEKLGNITLDGKVGSSADYFLYTTTSGTVTSKQKIGNITTSGAIGSTSGLPVITTTSGVLTTGSFGSTSGTFSEGNHNHTGTYAPLSHNHVLDDITDYLVTSISCDNYNPTIDGTVTVTVFVGDSDGNGVQGVSVPVTASSGNFTKLNGASITAASTVTGTTGVNGTFTLTYSCTEWGLITFSANNENIQIKVTGFKQVAQTTVSGVTYTCSVNGEGVGRVNLKCTSVSFAAGNSHEALNWIPSQYTPKGYYHTLTERKVSNTLILYLWEYKSLVGITNTSTSSQTRNLDIAIVYSY